MAKSLSHDNCAWDDLFDGLETDLQDLAPTGEYDDWKLKYFHDPVGFAENCITWEDGEGLTEYQKEIMRAVVREGRVCVRGPRGLGKTTVSAILVLWFALTRDGRDWKMPTTAGSWRQLSKYLWPEIHKWSRRLKWGEIGRKSFNHRTELLSLSLKLETGEAFAVASDVPELIEGAHADYLFFLYDESKSIPAKTFDASEGAFSNADVKNLDPDPTAIPRKQAFAAAVSTPGEPDGRFHEIQTGKKGFEDWWTKRVSLQDCIEAGMLSKSWAEQRLRQWGLDSQMYRNHVLGEFAANDEQGFIPLSWIERAMEFWADWEQSGKPGLHCSTGVDVGDGGDKSVWALRLKQDAPVRYTTPEGLERTFNSVGGVAQIRTSEDRGIMPVVGQTKNILDAKGGVAVIDRNGIGAGCVGRLRELGYNRQVVAFNGAEKAPVQARDATGELKFKNKRAWAYSVLKDLLNPNNPLPFFLPNDEELKADLSIPKALPLDSEGRLQIESKKDIKRRLDGRSTDKGDAVMQSVVSELDGKAKTKKRKSTSHSTM